MRARVSLHTHGRCARERVLTHTGGRTAAGRAAYLKCITCTTSPVPRLQSSRRFLLGVWPEPSPLSCPCPCPCPCDRPSTFACSPPLLSCPFSVCAVKAALSPPTASFPLIIFRSTPSLPHCARCSLALEQYHFPPFSESSIKTVLNQSAKKPDFSRQRSQSPHKRAQYRSKESLNTGET